jgi:hypothetical protein
MKNILTVCLLLASRLAIAQVDSLVVDWTAQTMVSHSTPTLQVVVNPPLRRGSSIHDPTFAALKALGCDYVRYVPWLPYPRLGVAELEPPSGQKTSWDFSVIDPMTIDFLHATEGHSVILNFSTIPQWMYKTDKPVSYPSNPDSVFWNYTQGSVPNDSTYQEIAKYYGRLYSWYTQGGFTDELGQRHTSGYHFNIPYWEVLNEVDFEHGNSVESYTKLYDAVVGEIKKISPGTKFVGMALADPNRPEWFEYFLNPKNHKPGIPVDMISYHFYAIGGFPQGTGIMQYTFFDQADGFLRVVRFIDNIRNRLSPSTKTTVDEIGSILSNDAGPMGDSIPGDYFNLSGATYAYVFLGLSRLGIDVIGESQLVGYPTQYPSVSMMDWKNGKPNARYWVLKLIKDNLGAGNTLVNASVSGGDELAVQGFLTKGGRRILLINKTNHTVRLKLPSSFNQAKLTLVDPSTGDEEPVPSSIGTADIEVKPFAVGMIAL